jgi:hypothetical protein
MHVCWWHSNQLALAVMQGEINVKHYLKEKSWFEAEKLQQKPKLCWWFLGLVFLCTKGPPALTHVPFVFLLSIFDHRGEMKTRKSRFQRLCVSVFYVLKVVERVMLFAYKEEPQLRITWRYLR